ncbi:MAG: diguanylate cyclase [Betaproteobacteria bacterium]|nr:diguanylate cyclase [Betaproteobacteria bacterium]
MATILIVDEPALARRLASLLEQRGDRLLEAADGEDALRIVRAENPELVLLDILMPKMDGHEFALRLRAESGRIPPRLVFLAAACIETGSRDLARACGAERLVTKPVRPEALLAVINAVLAAPRPGPGNPLPDPGAIATSVRLIASKLYQRATELEGLNTRLDLHAANCAERLETARAALEQEVTKRLWAEKELTQANLRLHDKAMRDALTGLNNRGYLEESLDRETSRARRSNQPFGVMMIDIDHFKRCNDRYGHAAGDAVLRAVGQYMLSLARGEDILCRYGGEEFVVVMAHASPGTVLERAETLRLGVQKLRIECDGQRVGPVTLSAGIAMFPDHGENGQAVLLAADAALYRAKQAGRNCIVAGNASKPQR